MAIDYEICFDKILDDLFLYDSKCMNVSYSSSDEISFIIDDEIWTLPMYKFILEGFRFKNEKIYSPKVRIKSNVDILVANSHPNLVYRIDGFLPDFSTNGVILNFDKTIQCVYNSKHILKIGEELLKNFKNVKVINYLFGDQREWRGDVTEDIGLQIQHLPISLMHNLTELEELNGSFSNLDNVISIPVSFLNNCRKLRRVSAFNDCRMVMDVKGCTISSNYLECVVMLNNMKNLSFIPSNIINCASSGVLLLSCLNNANSNLKKISFDKLVNVPNKRVFCLTDLVLDNSKYKNIIDCLTFEYGKQNVINISEDAELVRIWDGFFRSRVLPILRDKNDLGGIKHMKTKSLVYSIPPCYTPVDGLLFLDSPAHPAGLYPGTTWVQIAKDRFIRGAGSEPNGSIGGRSSLSLSLEHMPSHNHIVDNHVHTQPPHFHGSEGEHPGGYGRYGVYDWAHGVGYRGGFDYDNPSYKTSTNGGENTGGSTPSTNWKGNGAAFDITNPYYRVFIWKRLT